MEKDWKNLGEQILDTVADALNSGDFSQLNDLVSGTVNNVVEEVKRQADQKRAVREDDIIRFAQENAENREKWEKQQEEIRRRQEERREEWRNRQQQRLQQETQKRKEAEAIRGVAGEGKAQKEQNSRKLLKRVPFIRVGSVANVLNTVFGSLGIGLAIALGLVAVMASGGSGIFVAPMVYIAVILAVISISMMRKGTKQRELLHRAESYIKICGQKMYADIDELARHTGKSIRFVKNDLKKMIKKGLFPQGHLDKQETCVMLTDEVYRQYTEADRAYQAREEMKARENRPLTAEEQEQERKRQQENELNAMFAEGMSYVQKLRSLNDAIPGEEISDQLSQLENLLKQIFDRVREHPEQMDRMHKLMNYYLPTTVKLVEAYVDFEKVENPGPDIRDAKEEIQKTLGIINEAFVELLNNLFQETVFDVTTDAQVLQTMLAREGLRREMNAEPIPAAPAQTEGTSAVLSLQGIGEEDPAGPVLKAPWDQ